MDCQYCVCFQQSKWRVNPDPDDTSKKSKKRMRYCEVKKTYINGTDEKCPSFEPNKIFWCNNNHYWMDIDSCLARHEKGKEENCYGCGQHKIIVELMKARAFLKRKQAAEAARPTLLRRKL